MIGRWRTRLLAHLEMARPYTMFHSGLVALAGAVIVSQGRARRRSMALAMASTTLGWLAGLYAGDYYDRAIDAQSKPYRPIPSGRVAPREALRIMCLYIGLGYLCALAISLANLALALGTTMLGLAYARTFKGQGLMGNFDRGLLGALAVLFGALAGWRDLPPASRPATLAGLLLGGLIFCHDAASNLVGALRDVEGDREAGCLTAPVVYGLARASMIACLLALCSTALALLLFWRLLPRRRLALVLYGTSLAVALRVYVRLWRERHTVTRGQALAMHKALVVERLLLVGGIIGTALPARITLAVLATVLAATTSAQTALRDRYEAETAP